MKTVDLCAHCGAVCGPEGCPEHGMDRVIRNVPRHNALAIMVDCAAYGDRAMAIWAVCNCC